MSLDFDNLKDGKITFRKPEKRSFQSKINFKRLKFVD